MQAAAPARHRPLASRNPPFTDDKEAGYAVANAPYELRQIGTTGKSPLIGLSSPF